MKQQVKKIEEGRYLYGVVDSGKKMSLGEIGIDGHEVYTIPYQRISAVVHSCLARPYKSKDERVVRGWVITHENVVEKVWEEVGTILPLGFDCITKANEDRGAEERVIDWLKEEYDILVDKLNKVKDKAEYVVKVSWDIKVITEKLLQKDQELKGLEEKIRSLSRGTAYMYKQKLEKILKEEMEKEANHWVKDFYERIRKSVDDLKVEDIKKLDSERQVLLNLSCLLYRGKTRELGEELEKINNMKGFTVHFTGPWPPYSFV